MQKIAVDIAHTAIGQPGHLVPAHVVFCGHAQHFHHQAFRQAGDVISSAGLGAEIHHAVYRIIIDDQITVLGFSRCIGSRKQGHGHHGQQHQRNQLSKSTHFLHKK